MVALALANERGRRYVEVSATMVSAIAPRVVQKVLDPFAYFAERCKDPEWGWERSRWN